MSLRRPRRFLAWRAKASTVCSLRAYSPLRPGSSFFHSHHSTMSSPPVEYGYVDEVEHLSDYRPGGYHPVHIDDRLSNRYQVVHKLGHGTFSTAWLALDEKTSRYVAVKVGTADAEHNEVDILSHIRQGIPSGTEWEDKLSLIPAVLDRFDLTGPNGTHPCLVTLPARCSLRDTREAPGSALFQLDVARSLAAQLVLAISLVHSQGYAHGGKSRSVLSADCSANMLIEIFTLAICSYNRLLSSIISPWNNSMHSTENRNKSPSSVWTHRQHQLIPVCLHMQCLRFGWEHQAAQSPSETPNYYSATLGLPFVQATGLGLSHTRRLFSARRRHSLSHRRLSHTPLTSGAWAVSYSSF